MGATLIFSIYQKTDKDKVRMNYKKSSLFYIAALLITVIGCFLVLPHFPGLLFGFPYQKQVFNLAFQHISEAKIQLQQFSRVMSFSPLELMRLI